MATNTVRGVHEIELVWDVGWMRNRLIAWIAVVVAWWTILAVFFATALGQDSELVSAPADWARLTIAVAAGVWLIYGIRTIRRLRGSSPPTISIRNSGDLVLDHPGLRSPLVVGRDDIDSIWHGRFERAQPKARGRLTYVGRSGETLMVGPRRPWPSEHLLVLLRRTTKLRPKNRFLPGAISSPPPSGSPTLIGRISTNAILFAVNNAGDGSTIPALSEDQLPSEVEQRLGW